MSETLQHRGYTGSVLYSAEDRLLHGKILGIRDWVLYEGEGVESIERNFREAVDDYLQFCQEQGKTPDLPSQIAFEVQVPTDLRERASRFAELHNTQLNTVVQQALTQYLAHAE